jgi:hypothetical protein
VEQLQELAASGQLQASDLVWKEGMAEWTPAGSVEGLMPAAPPGAPAPAPGAPPPMPAAAAPPPATGFARLFDGRWLTQPYEGEMWTKVVAWSGFGVAFLGVCLPWLTVDIGPFGGGSISGWEYTMGVLAGLAALAGGGLTAVPFNWSVLAGAGGALITVLLSFIKMISLLSDLSDVPTGAPIGLGFGVILTLLGGIAAGVGPAAVIFGFGKKKR